MLLKCVSGGQQGADIAGLIAATKCGLKTGGVMPKGFLTSDGPRPEYAELYGVTEHTSSKYPPRTYQNCKQSDGTIRFAANWSSAGEQCTLKAINQHKKPYLDIDISDIKNNFKETVFKITHWIQKNRIEILNVAGNREQTAPGIEKLVTKCLIKVFKLLEKEYANDRDNFIKHLEDTKKIVATWPEWKRKILGTIDSVEKEAASLDNSCKTHSNNISSVANSQNPC